jgi:hypothetical protein
MRFHPRRLALPAILILGRAALAAAQGGQVEGPKAETSLPKVPPVQAVRMAGEIKLDGILDESAWASAARIDTFFETVFGDNRSPVVKTLASVGYDDKYLYIGLNCDDPDPTKLRAPFTDRDQVFGTDDNIAILIDTLGDKRVAQEFRVSPRGIQGDAVFNDSSGSEDFSPDFYYDTAAKITDTGWTAEVRIPFSSLRYKPVAEQKWGIMIWRNYPRDRRYAIYSSPIARGSNCFVCNLADLRGLSDLPTSRHLVVAPYASGQEVKRSSVPGGALAGEGADSRFGLDFKWTPFASTAIDLTVNPDFSQVETDTAQIAVNNRFALFFPEKRPFFLEGVDLLDTPIPVFYSRSITSPKFGARVTGNAAGVSYTALLVKDEGGGSVILPGAYGSDFAPQDFESNVGVLRARRELGKSFIGATATVKENEGGSFNRVFGLDFQWRPSERDRVSGQALISRTQTPVLPTFAPEWDGRRLSDRGLQVSWEHSVPKWDLRARFDDLGDRLRVDLGFVPQVGYRQYLSEAGYRMYPTGLLSFARVFASGEYVEDQQGGVISRSATPLGFFVSGKKNLQAFAGFSVATFRTGPELLSRKRVNYFVQADPSRRLTRLTVQGFVGEDIDLASAQVGKGGDLTLNATLRPEPHLTLEAIASTSWLRSRDDSPGRGARLFSADVLRLKATYNASSRAFLRLIAQHTSSRRYANTGVSRNAGFSGSALLSYRINWQTALYLGYGDDRALGDENRLERTGRQLFAKLSYSLQR